MDTYGLEPELCLKHSQRLNGQRAVGTDRVCGHACVCAVSVWSPLLSNPVTVILTVISSGFLCFIARCCWGSVSMDTLASLLNLDIAEVTGQRGRSLKTSRQLSRKQTSPHLRILLSSHIAEYTVTACVQTKATNPLWNICLIVSVTCGESADLPPVRWLTQIWQVQLLKL